MSDTESQMLRTKEHLNDLDAQITAMELVAQEAEKKAQKEQEEHGKRLAAMKAAAEEKKKKAEEERKQVEEERQKAEEEAWRKAEEEARKKAEDNAAEEAWKKAAVVKGKGKARADSPLSSPENQPTQKHPRQQIVVELPACVGEPGPSWRMREYDIIDMASESGSLEEEGSKPGGQTLAGGVGRENTNAGRIRSRESIHVSDVRISIWDVEKPAPKRKRRVANRSDTGSVWSEESVGRIGALVEVARGIQMDLGQILGMLQQISGGMRVMQNDIKTNDTLLEALARKSRVPEDKILRAYDGGWDEKEKRLERPEERLESSDVLESRDEEDEEEDEVQGEVRRGGMEVDE